LPDDYGNTFYIIFFIGIAQLVDMVTSVNIEIIASSKHYRLNTYFVFISIVVAIIFNWIFIPLYGIEGAALGTLLAVMINNTLRTIAVGRIFKIYPLNMGTFKSLFVIVVCYVVMIFIPNADSPILDFLLRGIVITAIYLPLTYLLNISNDINSKLDKIIRR
jgi:O-antigen/teichoic acid export membrane protein